MQGNSHAGFLKEEEDSNILSLFKKNPFFFKNYYQNRIITDNPAKRTLKNIKVYPNERPPFTEEEVHNLVKCAPNNFHRYRLWAYPAF